MNSKKSFKDSIVPVIIGGAVFLVLFTSLLFIINTTETPNDEIGLGFLAISYQVIFLTTSLLSMLSDRSETIYWERFTEYVMVTPWIMNFTGLSIAGYVSLIAQTICFFNPRWRLAFFTSFSIGIAIIIILWWKMSSIFFSRNHYLEKLKETELGRIQDLEKLEQLNRSNSPLTKASLLTIKQLFSIKEWLNINCLLLKKEQSKITDILSNKEFKIKNRLYTLRELTYSAIDIHNSRVIQENIKYFVDIICDQEINNEDVKSKAIDFTLDIFDYLDSHNQSDWISNLMHEKSVKEKIKENQRLTNKIAEWILRDHSRIKIWNNFIECVYDSVVDPVGAMHDMLDKLDEDLYPYPINVEKGQEIESGVAILSFEDKEEITKIKKKAKKYEGYLINYVSFICKNDLSEELEMIIERLTVNHDLILVRSVVCWNNNCLDYKECLNSFDIVLDVIGKDDHLLMNFITAYRNVMFMTSHDNIIWTEERDNETVDKIMNIYNRKQVHYSILDSVYETFMREFVPASSTARKKYVKKLIETKDYKKLESVISFDIFAYDSIKDQDLIIDAESESYYRLSLLYEGRPASAVVPLGARKPYQDSGSENSTNGSGVSDEPATVQSDEMGRDSQEEEQKEIELELNNILVKMEFRPTGKNKKDMIDFWMDIRELIPDSEEDVLEELDDYLSILTGANSIADEKSDDNPEM